MGGGGGSMESGEPEFQIAPMIDCLLVLLIFFMSITTASVLQIEKGVVLPVAPDAKKPERGKVQEEGMVTMKWISADQPGVFYFENEDYEPDKLPVMVSRLRERKEQIPGYKVNFRGDARLNALDIQTAMQVMADAGFSDISFSTLNK